MKFDFFFIFLVGFDRMGLDHALVYRCNLSFFFSLSYINDESADI